MARKTTPPVTASPFNFARLVVDLRLLADTHRLRVLLLLSERAHNVTEITSALGQAQPTVSHHLSLLRVGGLIEADRRGKCNYYAPTPRGMVAVEAVRAMAAA